MAVGGWHAHVFAVPAGPSQSAEIGIKTIGFRPCFWSGTPRGIYVVEFRVCLTATVSDMLIVRRILSIVGSIHLIGLGPGYGCVARTNIRSVVLAGV